MIDSCVVRDCGAHAYVPHMSNGISFRDCIAHDVTDHAYWWDDFDETDDTLWENCVASKVAVSYPERYVNSGFRHQAGKARSNVARGCVAVGVQGSGFFWDAAGSGEWIFDDCLAHHCTEAGLRAWQNNGLDHVINRFIAYRNGSGISHGAYGNIYHYADCQLVGNTDSAMTISAVSEAAIPAGLKFERTLFDASGADYAVSTVDGNAVIAVDATLYQECEFRGAKKAAIEMFAHNDQNPNRLKVVNCTFEGNEFWIEPDVGSNARIEVQDATRGHLLLGRIGTRGTTTRPWNASVATV